MPSWTLTRFWRRPASEASFDPVRPEATGAAWPLASAPLPIYPANTKPDGVTVRKGGALSVLSSPMRRILAAALMFMSSVVFATPQEAEVILVNDEPTPLLAEPLAPLLEQQNIAGNLHAALGEWCTTANWRGYVGTWEIRDGALYLVKLGSRCHKPSEVPVDAVIPGASSPQRAYWFSGNLTIPLVKRNIGWHLGEEFMLMRYELVTVVHGVVTDRTTIERPRHGGSTSASSSPRDND